MSEPSEKGAARAARRERVPVLPLRDMVVFPGTLVTLLVGRGRSLAALEHALLHDRTVLVVSQKDAGVENPGADDLNRVGTLVEVLQVVKLIQGGGVRVLVEGLARAHPEEVAEAGGHIEARPAEIADVRASGTEIEALRRTVVDQFEQYLKLNRRLPPETLLSVTHVSDPGRLADAIAGQIQVRVDEKQRILELADGRARLERLAVILSREIEVSDMEKRIHGRVRKQIERSQREYYLNEQMKAIQRELGRPEEAASEAADLRRKVEASAIPAEAKAKALRELERLERMMPLSAEATVARTYVEWMLAMPFGKRTKDRLDLAAAQRVLDEDHYGLGKVKDRVVEHLAVRKLTAKAKDAKPTATILCFVGPPGVGKTSLAKSIARAMGRKFVRVSLGGVRDEAEIRGHRRTYIGSMPGRLIQGMKKAGTMNPVFLLDEVDKLGADFRGDPASALLEVLDPEQNRTFNDHYLDVDFDLSEVFFVTTANSTQPIPSALLDRMEVVRLSGYTDLEKREIARRFLLPKLLSAHGLKNARVAIAEGAIDAILADYTREAGVRNLERELTSICRKLARRLASSKAAPASVGAGDLPELLGPPKHRRDREAALNGVGVATGLAYTENGGEVLSIEVALVRGRGGVALTGKLGVVMRESALAAISWARSRAASPRGLDLHVHVPEGAVPKDGPSAGVTMAVAVLSALTGRPVAPGLAMTGEVTLRGRVLAVGGLKEKLLAADRAGVRLVLIPGENVVDLAELPDEVKARVRIEPVREMSEVLSFALPGVSDVPLDRPAETHAPLAGSVLS